MYDLIGFDLVHSNLKSECLNDKIFFTDQKKKKKNGINRRF